MKKLLIIGGSHGIGQAIIELAKNDYEIINISRTSPSNKGDIQESYSLDITKDELPDLEAVDKLVYCPGSIPLKPFKSSKLSDFEEAFNLNVLGAVKALKKYAPLLEKSSEGSVVLYSTVASQVGMGFHAIVSSVKSALEGLSKSLAAELAPKVRVNCIAPSITDTPLASGILRNEKMFEKMIDKHPMKRINEAKDVAGITLFLLSDLANSITGQTIISDNGLSTIQ